MPLSEVHILACAGWDKGVQPTRSPAGLSSQETPTQPPVAYQAGPRPRPSVPVTCLRVAQSASVALRLAIQTAAPPACRDPRRGGRRRHCLPAMEHRIVGPGPYRATKLVSDHAGAGRSRRPRTGQSSPLQGWRGPGLEAGHISAGADGPHRKTGRFPEGALGKAYRVWSSARRWGACSFVPRRRPGSRQ